MPGANPGGVEVGAERDGRQRHPDATGEDDRRRHHRAGKYVDATINKENMLQRIHTWVPEPHWAT